MPLRLGDQNETVRQWRYVMHARFGGDTGLYARLHGPLPTDTDKFGPRAQNWQKEYQVRTGQASDFGAANGVVSDGDLEYLGITVLVRPPSGQVCVGITLGGAASRWDLGYQYDLGEALDRSRCYHQPVGFNTNPIPMNTGVQDGVNRTVTELTRPRLEFGGRNCETIPWFCPLAYSMGSIVWMIVLMRVLYGDLQRFKKTFMGSNSFGNPAREDSHGLPGGILVEGPGIAYDKNFMLGEVPECHWDLTAEKGMIGSPGNDLYAKVDGGALSVRNMRAVWKIINTGNPLNLGMAVADLMLSPSFDEGWGAGVAAFKALDFFIVKRLTPHTAYQFVQPIAGDPRDCWRVALDHSADIVRTLPRPFA
jgi:hypothetical protein